MSLIDILNFSNINNVEKRKIVVPAGYRELLRDMTVDVLRSQPDDPVDFCIKWLEKKKDVNKDKVDPVDKLSRTSSESDLKKKINIKMNKTSSEVEIKEPDVEIKEPKEEINEHEASDHLHVSLLSPDKVYLESNLFSNVPKKDFEGFLDKIEEISVNNGDEITITSDHPSDKIYIVEHGKFDFFQDYAKVKMRVGELHNLGYFGEIVENMRCHAKGPGKLVAISRSLFSKEIFEKIQEKRNLYAEFLEDIELFEKLSEFERRLIADSIVEKDFEPNQIMVKEGDMAFEMYLIFEGFGVVTQDGKEINTVAEGGFFGELALKDGEPRIATVTSTSDCKLLAINVIIFKGIIEPKCRAYLDKVIKSYFKSSDDDDDESDLTTPPFEKVNLPRKSVSAGKFNPEMMEEDDEEEIAAELAKPELRKTEAQMEKLRHVCKNILLFRCLDDEQIDVVIGVMFPRSVVPGDIIIQYGDDGDNFYIIESGVYDIKVPIKGVETKVAQFNNEGSFGELALMYNTPRSATVVATTEGKLWALTREMFRTIVLKRAFQKRIMYENLIGQVPLLKELSSYEKMNIADALRTRIYDAGTNIINQGDEGFEMFFIEEGRVEILVDFEDGLDPELIGELERGKYFGEMALITHKPRAASAIAKTKCKIAVLDRDCFERLLGPCVDVMKRNIEEYNNTVTSRKSIVQALQEDEEGFNEFDDDEE